MGCLILRLPKLIIDTSPAHAHSQHSFIYINEYMVTPVHCPAQDAGTSKTGPGGEESAQPTEVTILGALTSHTSALIFETGDDVPP